MNLLTSWDPTDPVWLILMSIVGLLVIYYVVRWMRSSSNYRDSSDDYAKSCLEVLGFGCAVPLGLVVVLIGVLVW